jgi:hypothetical protein
VIPMALADEGHVRTATHVKHKLHDGRMQPLASFKGGRELQRNATLHAEVAVFQEALALTTVLQDLVVSAAHMVAPRAAAGADATQRFAWFSE